MRIHMQATQTTQTAQTTRTAHHARGRQRGAVSLFSVVFAMLLMTIITISFLRIMIADQTEATNNDLAQSAYDSAQAGVEDAKRALVWYANNCKGGSAPSGCASIASNVCNQAIVKATGLTETNGEIKVQQSAQVDESGKSIDQALDQAYTCVTMKLNTDDYVASVAANQSIYVPLRGTNTFNSVKIEWFSQEDLSTASSTAKPDTSATLPKAMVKSWPTDRPSVLRTQFMQIGSSFTLSDFDSVTSEGKSDANTVFLYPSTVGVSSTSLVSRDTRSRTEPASSNSAPLPTQCQAAIPSGGYSCSMTITLPTPVGATDRNEANTTAYLRLTSLYAASHIRVSLGDGAQFNEVQPIVDSTGRASDVFRRVQSRVNLYDTSSFPYPDAAVDTSNNLCKDFSITDTDYYSGSCNP